MKNNIKPLFVVFAAKQLSLFAITFAFVFFAGCFIANAQTNFTATLNGVQETPANNSPGTGTATVVLNQAQTQITVTLNFGGLSGAQTAAHIHSGATGASGPVEIGLPNGNISSQVISISPAQVSTLNAGNLYFNIHSSTFGGGEIRGQILAPLAANVTVGGQISMANGAGIRNVIVTLTETNGQIHTTRTGVFGYYRFDDIEIGTVIINIRAKRFTFINPTQVLSVSDNVGDINFTAIE